MKNLNEKLNSTESEDHLKRYEGFPECEIGDISNNEYRGADGAKRGTAHLHLPRQITCNSWRDDS